MNVMSCRLNPALLIEQGQLKYQTDGEDGGHGKNTLCKSCGEMEMIHDVLRSVE
jgi:hypothetical protein